MLRNDVQTNMLRSLFSFMNLNQCDALEATPNPTLRAKRLINVTGHWNTSYHHSQDETRNSSSRSRVEGP